MADLNEERGSTVNRFTESLGVFGAYTKVINRIDASAKIAAINAERIRQIIPTAFALVKQPISSKITPPPIDTISEVAKKTASTFKSTFSLSNILSAFLIAIPFLISDKVKANLKEYFSNLLSGLGFTKEAIDRIGTAAKIAGIAVMGALGLKILSPVIKTVGLLFKLGRMILLGLEIITATGGTDIDLPGSDQKTTKTGPEPTPTESETAKTKTGKGAPGSEPIGRPPVPILDQKAVTSIPRAVAAQGYAPPPQRIMSDTKALPAPPGARPAETLAQKAKRVGFEDVGKKAGRASMAFNKMIGISKNVGRVIPILNLVIGGYDIYQANELYQAGNTADAINQGVIGLGTVLMGVAELFALPAMLAVGTALSIGGALVWLVRLFNDWVKGITGTEIDTSVPADPEAALFEGAQNEKPMQFKQSSQDVQLEAIKKRIKRNDAVILTQPILYIR